MEEASVEVSPEVSAALEQESSPFVGRWNQLVSSTNWEKGRIIYQWREALIEADAPVSEYSDEAWARRVERVSGQHVGRLRRVYHRFGETYHKFDNLYWSHFQAALDWDDAEMWLEGAVHSKWSVSQMRRKRFETVGGLEPSDADIVTSETDEDYTPLSADDSPSNLTGEFEGVEGPRHEGPDFGDEPQPGAAGSSTGESDSPPSDSGGADEAAALVRPFEDIPELPDDLADAFDQLKIAILAHKRNQWQDVPLQDVTDTLEAFKTLAAAPSDEM